MDLDATDDALHGNQEGRFFHGYYGHYCYLPLYVASTCCAAVCAAPTAASDGAVEELTGSGADSPALANTKILVRGEGFCREPIMTWCEGNGVDYGSLARNARPEAHRQGAAQVAATLRGERSGVAAVPGVPLPDAGLVEPEPPGGGQGRVAAWRRRRQSALRGDQPRPADDCQAGPLRRAVLRPW